MKAADVMVRDVVTVAPDATVRDVAKMLLEHRISAVPVVDGDGGLAGIVSEGDLMRRGELGTERHRAWWLSLFMLPETLTEEFIKSLATKVSDVMTRNVFTAEEDTPLADIADLLEEHHVKRVPIIRGGRVVGIVSRANIVQALASLPAKEPAAGADGDLEIRQAILDRIAAAAIGAPWLLNVIVHDGVAELWGVAESESQKRAVVVAAEATAGVKSIQDHMLARPVVGD
ncbi:Inosine-5'-monophosphate dehydrogenase [Lutibaculum baratangense AMV1]|uniref:Inosine-5'-monophosphate dehydrogenase n=2 Tax=Lutibaculum TaxID=1358438 RepID=V4RJF6_9HYPH|nr:Inosine-5'-monophosphate dehydrogenase [Lutibaculum baratangense AMV1]